MKKILFVATVVKAHINVFHLPYIKMFHEEGYEVHVAAKNDFVGESCVIPNCDLYYDVEFSRFPFNLSNISAYRKLKKIIKDNQYDIVHCHTPVAGVITRIAARNCRNTTVVYTAHGFHFFKGAPLINWLIYYPIERFCAIYTDKLITINKEDYENASKFKMRNNGKVYYVPGVGVDLSKYNKNNFIRDAKRKELGIDNSKIMILSVGELSKRKNHEIAIRALAKMKNQDFIYLVCGRGVLLEPLKILSKKLGIDDKVKFLGFRTDVPEICRAADIFLFTSYQEGLPVALMEAMAAGLPCVASKIRGNIDLIDQGVGGLFANPNDADGFAKCIEFLANNVELCKNMGIKNIEKIKKYNIKNVRQIMHSIYRELLG
ncbi:MAG: glycosyltransferase family 4 protein [Acholeplasmataceae bacterium]|nr:glycosyltransferase family 4 protein [Acholeplasmataceae bacterium]